jgi:hypothetical protein
MGLVVQPAKAIASPILGTKIAKMYDMKIRTKVQMTFSLFVMRLFPLRIISSTVSLEGRYRSGMAKYTDRNDVN